MLAGTDEVWLQHHIASFDGTVYHQPDLPAHLVTQTLYYSQSRPPFYRYIGSGANGSAYDIGGLVIKRFHDTGDENSRVSGLRSLQLNVALHAALNNCSQPLIDTHFNPGQSFNIIAPEIFAGFIPSPGSAGHPVWLMAKASGKTPAYEEVPFFKCRTEYLKAAIGDIGIDPLSVEYDDKEENLRLALSDKPGQPHTITKLDVEPVYTIG